MSQSESRVIERAAKTTPAGRRAIRAAGLCFLLSAVAVTAQDSAERKEGPRGLALSTELGRAVAVASDLAALSPGEERSPTLWVRVPWNEIEALPGLRDWDAVDRLTRVAEEGLSGLLFEVVGPTPEGHDSPLVAGEQAGWDDFVTELAGRCSKLEIPVAIVATGWAADATAPGVKEQAFLLKKTSLAVAAGDPRLPTWAGAVPVAGDPLARQQELLAQGVAPFLAGYVHAGLDAGSRASIRSLLAREDGTAAHVERTAAGAGEAWRAALELLGTGPELAVLSASTLSEDELAGLAVLGNALPPEARPAVEVGEPFVRVEPAGGVTWQRWVLPDLSSRIVVQPAAGGPDAVVLHFSSSALDDPRLHDPAGERSGRLPGLLRIDAEDRSRLRLELADRPLVLELARRERLDDLDEDIAVASEREWTVDEVMSRYLRVQAREQRALSRWTAELSTQMRYRLGGSGRAIEVRIDGGYLEEDGLREVENRQYFVNGAPLKGKNKLPELPLLQPEKVTVAPLGVYLDKHYQYRLLGRETVSDRAAFKVSFEPLATQSRRVQGTIWIDAVTFQRLRVKSVEEGLEAPLLSDQRTDYFETMTTPEGDDVMVITHSEIQRAVTIIGATVVIDMRQDYSDHRLNPSDFARVRAEVMASDNQVLRDTEEGFRYLRKNEEGQRELSDPSTRKILAIAGARYDPGYSGVLPLAGVNWLDHDFRGKGWQLNAFLAGAINTITLSDPQIGNSRFEANAELFAPFIARSDRLRRQGEGTIDALRVKARRPHLEVGVSRAMGQGGRLGLALRLEHENWSDTDDTDPAFVLPEDGLVARLRLNGEWRRDSIELKTFVERGHRLDWEPWGIDDGSGLTESPDSYWRYGASIEGVWLLPAAQRLSVGAAWRSGSSLDRFSQHQFRSFGEPNLPGFGGSGLHFDDLAMVDLSYGLDLFGRFGVSGEIGLARTRDRQGVTSVGPDAREWSDHVGAGVSGTVPGPWGTFVTFGVGTVLSSSDHPELEGDLTAELLVTKIIK
ncbi:MAG: hypothetical protein AAF533_02640 [Acidobacteriota bacterium]